MDGKVAPFSPYWGCFMQFKENKMRNFLLLIKISNFTFYERSHSLALSSFNLCGGETFCATWKWYPASSVKLWNNEMLIQFTSSRILNFDVAHKSASNKSQTKVWLASRRERELAEKFLNKFHTSEPIDECKRKQEGEGGNQSVDNWFYWVTRVRKRNNSWVCRRNRKKETFECDAIFAFFFHFLSLPSFFPPSMKVNIELSESLEYISSLI